MAVEGQRSWTAHAKPTPDRLRRLAVRLPRPLRFLAVGGVGLVTDLGVFSLVFALGPHPLAARIVSIAAATLMTWRLNRALTFDSSGRKQTAEAMRYAVVTLMAQGASYMIFAALVLTVLRGLPQLALLIGAACAAFISYNGHRLYAFAAHRGVVAHTRSS